jgi:hypothetical protein
VTTVDLLERAGVGLSGRRAKLGYAIHPAAIEERA